MNHQDFDIGEGDTQCVIVVCHPSVDKNLIRTQLAGKFNCDYVVISAEDETVGTEPNTLIIDDDIMRELTLECPDFILHQKQQETGGYCGYFLPEAPDCTKKRRDLSLSNGIHTNDRPHGWYNKFNRSKR